MDKQRFLKYIDHFNHKRYEEVMEYYDPDVVIEYPTMLANPKAPPVTRKGRAGFLQQYVALHQNCREALEVGDFLIAGNMIAAEMYTEFHFLKDYPDFSGRSMKAGDVYIPQIGASIIWKTTSSSTFVWHIFACTIPQPLACSFNRPTNRIFCRPPVFRTRGDSPIALPSPFRYNQICSVAHSHLHSISSARFGARI